jgi:hypothetical protein
MKNIAPNRANMSRMTSTTPADSATERNSRSGSSGSLARRSRRTNSTPATAAAAKNPTLLAANLRYIHEHDDELVVVLARREGVDPATDRRPRLLAAMFGAIIFLADREWRDQGSAGPEAMVAAFDAYAGQLTAALAGHWTGS